MRTSRDNEDLLERGVPPDIINAFDNTEDLVRHISEDGCEELNFSTMDKDNSIITSLGIQLEMFNRNAEIFRVIVCPDIFSDNDIFRRHILLMSEDIQKNYPYLISDN